MPNARKLDRRGFNGRPLTANSAAHLQPSASRQAYLLTAHAWHDMVRHEPMERVRTVVQPSDLALLGAKGCVDIQEYACFFLQRAGPCFQMAGNDRTHQMRQRHVSARAHARRGDPSLVKRERIFHGRSEGDHWPASMLPTATLWAEVGHGGLGQRHLAL